MLKETFAAIVVSFAVFGSAWGQTSPEQKPDPKPAAAEEKQGAQPRHEHARDHKQGAPAPKTADASTNKAKKKPLHDHGKTHKQQ